MMSFRRMMAAAFVGLLGVVVVHGAVVQGAETTVPPLPPVAEIIATLKAPPVAEVAFVEVDVEVPDVAYIIVDGATQSTRGTKRKVRIARDGKRTFATVVANWSEAGQDRRIERSVNLNKPTKLVFTLDDLNANEQQLLDLTNQSRANSGLSMLRIDPRLCRAARLHSANMARLNSMSHYLDGKSHQHRTMEAGYPSGMVAENICASQSTPQSAINTWLNSSGHRANMLSYQYSDLGVGIGYSSNGQPYYTQVFGR
jgi:uncharacterized protein YkwD